MSGSVNALSFRLGSSMSWGYSTSPTFLSFKLKNSMLLSKLLPAVMRRFGLHVVEFYSFFESSFLLFILISKLLALRQRTRRRFGRRRSRRKKAFHRITYSLNKNFVNWRILSFVRNSFRSYKKVSRMLSYHFYAKFIKLRYSHKNLFKRVNIGKKIIKHFKRSFFPINSRTKSLSKLFKLTAYLRRLFFKRHFFLKLRGLRFYFSPSLLSKYFLNKKYLLYKRYVGSKHKIFTGNIRLSRKVFTGSKRRFNGDSYKKRYYSFSYKFSRGRRTNYRKLLRIRRPVFSSFKQLHARSLFLSRVSSILLVKTLLLKSFFKPRTFSNFLKRHKTFRLKRTFMVGATPLKTFSNKNILSFNTLRSKKNSFDFSRLRSVLLLKYFSLPKNAKYTSRTTFCANALLNNIFKKLYSTNMNSLNTRLFLSKSYLLNKKNRISSFVKRKARMFLLNRQNSSSAVKNRVAKNLKKSVIKFFRRVRKSTKAQCLSNFKILSLFFLLRRLAFFKSIFFLSLFYKHKRLRNQVSIFSKPGYYYVRRVAICQVKLSLKNVIRKIKKKYLIKAYLAFLTNFNFFFKRKLSIVRQTSSFSYKKRKLKKIKNLGLKNLVFFNRQKSKLVKHSYAFFKNKVPNVKSVSFLLPYRIRPFLKKKWILKKNFEFFTSQFLQLLTGLPVNVFFLDGLTLFNKLVHAERILALKLVFKRAFISRKNFFFFKNFVNLLFQAIFFKTVWSITRYFSRVYYYRKTQKHTTQTVSRIFRTLNLRTIRFVGINILISGKIGRRRRAKSICFTKSKLPNLATLSLKVQYCYTQCITNFGVYGIKTWLYNY